jgi:RNA polymerase sigma factor (sigma-70 family)
MLIHLNPHQKEAIQLKYFHDLDYQTIATITSVSIGTVKSRIFQGLKKLRNHYRGDLGE